LLLDMTASSPLHGLEDLPVPLSLFECLSEYLWKRTCVGAGVTELYLVVCPKEDRTPMDMALLRRSVPIVAWDEDGQGEGNVRGCAAETRAGWDPLGVIPQEH